MRRIFQRHVDMSKAQGSACQKGLKMDEEREGRKGGGRLDSGSERESNGAETRRSPYLYLHSLPANLDLQIGTFRRQNDA